MENITDISAGTERRARKVLNDSGVIRIWEEVGAEVRIVGSLAMGLMMTHRDIDLHIYTDRLDPAADFAAMARLAANPAVERVTFANLAATEEECLEWHAWLRDESGDEWQLDMIHIRRGSRYDGYFERMAERIRTAMTPEQRETILQLKYETPVTEHIAGVEYYMAVIRDGIGSYAEFLRWRAAHTFDGIIDWQP